MCYTKYVSYKKCYLEELLINFKKENVRYDIISKPTGYSELIGYYNNLVCKVRFATQFDNLSRVKEYMNDLFIAYLKEKELVYDKN